MRLVTYLALVLGVVTDARGAIVELRAVKVNDVPIAPTPDLAVLPGDRIEVEIFISDWASELSEANVYQATLDPLSFVTGDSGVLLPIRHRGPMPLFYPCVSDADCVPEAHCGLPPEDVCFPDDSCNSDMDCLADEFCTSDQFCALEVPPNAGAPEFGVLIDADRPDFIFAGLDPLAAVSLYQSPLLKLGSALLGLINAEDNGIPRYAGTIIVEASTADSPYGQACGAFELQVLEDPNLSFLAFLPENQFVFLVPVPMSISVSCVVGSCCDTLAGSCMDDVGDLACQGDGQVFYPNLLCSEVDCEPAAIPALSEWGLLTLTLLLLTGAKTRFGRAFARRESDANAGL